MPLPTHKTAFDNPIVGLPDNISSYAGSAAGVQQALQNPSDELLTYLNAIKAALTSGTEGAALITTAAISGVTGTNVQAMLASLKALIDFAAIGTIPDGSITDAKLDDNGVKAKAYQLDYMDAVTTTMTRTDGVLTQVDESIGGTLRKRTALTYTGGVLTESTETVYDTDGTTVLKQWTDTLTYTDGVLTSTVRAVIA